MDQQMWFRMQKPGDQALWSLFPELFWLKVSNSCVNSQPKRPKKKKKKKPKTVKANFKAMLLRCFKHTESLTCYTIQ